MTSKIEFGGFWKIMKKFMILLLSLAVLFSFAACDNSSDTPADEPATPTGPNAADRFVATQLEDYLNEADLTFASGQIAQAKAKLVDDNGKYSLVYTFANVPAVGSTPANNVTFTITGEDISDEDTAQGETEVRLTTWTLAATGYDDQAASETLSYEVVGLTGAVQGSLVVTDAVTTPQTPAAIKSLTITRVFAADSVGSVSVSDSNGTYPVDVDNFFAQLNSQLDGNQTLSSAYIAEAKYTELMTAEYEKAAKSYADAVVAGITTTYLNGLVDDGTGKAVSGVSTNFTKGDGETASTATITFKVPSGDAYDNTATSVKVATNASGVNAVLAEGSTFIIKFETSEGEVSGATVEPVTYTLTADVVVNDATSPAPVVTGSNSVRISVSGTVTAGGTIAVPANTTLGASAFTDVTLEAVTAGTSTINDAAVAADTTAVSSVPYTYTTV